MNEVVHYQLIQFELHEKVKQMAKEDMCHINKHLSLQFVILNLLNLL
jgi:hypothetical protein